MLLTLLLFAYLTVVTFAAGRLVLRVGPWLGAGAAGPLPWPLTCLLGAAGLTAFLGWVWLWFPIDYVTHIATLAGLLFASATDKYLWATIVRLPRRCAQLRHSPALALLLAVLFFTILLRSAQSARLADTGGYHAPFIEWLRQFPAVPGLANLNYRFGFNNSWFLLNAFFAVPAGSSPWHGLNGWAVLMAVLFSAGAWQRSDATVENATFFRAGLAVGPLAVFHWTLSSPSPDVPAALCVLIALWFWLARPVAGWRWLLLVFAVSALTTKLSTLTIGLLPAVTLLEAARAGRWRIWLTTAATFGLFTGYWWFSMYLLTGYIVYPTLSPLADWFSVDWKVPKLLIEQGINNLATGTKAGFGPDALPTEWVKTWFLTRPLLEQVVAVTLVFCLIWTIWRRAETRGPRGWALLAAWAGVLFWFWVAPDLRFGIGSVWAVLLLGAESLGQRAGSVGPGALGRTPGVDPQTQPSSTPSALRPPPFALRLLPFILSGLLLFAAIRREALPVVWPAPYPTPVTKTYYVAQQPILYPTNDLRTVYGIRGYWGRCYDAPLPCSAYPNPQLRLRGQTLRSGFRTETP